MVAHPISMAISLFFVINVLGNIPLYIALLGRYSAKKQRMILVREFAIALLILLAFNYFGAKIFEFLGITHHILGKEKGPKHEPMIVPLATPAIAGPGSITAVMIFSTRVGETQFL